MWIFLFSLLFAARSVAPPDDGVADLQKHWDETTSFQASFTQKIQPKGSNAGIPQAPSVGTVYVSKPGKLRWDDKTSHLTDILNGKQYWQVTDPQDEGKKRVEYREDVSSEFNDGSLEILSGNKKFKDFFKVRVLSNDSKSITVEMQPKAGLQEKLIVKISKKDYVIQSLTSETSDSKTVVEFTDIKRNIDLPESKFEDEKPKKKKKD
jgi:outer membrane lipoprotein-sorting protein